MSDSDTEQSDVLITQIADAKKNIQALKKERKQISNQIETLMNDLECARRAKEVSDAAALNILKRLRELFGNGFNTEDLADKIIELQTRSRKAKEEVDDLTEKAKREEQEKLEKQEKAKQEKEFMNKEIETSREKEKETEDQIAEIQKKIQDQKRAIKDEENKFNDINAMKNGCDVFNTFNIDAIIKKIGENSDEALAKECRTLSNSLDIAFDGNITNFINDLTSLIKDLKQGYEPRIPKNELAKQVNNELKKLSDLKKTKQDISSDVKKMKAELQKLLFNNTNDDNLLDSLTKEKKKKQKRMKLLKETLIKASQIASTEIDVGEGLSGICSSYISFADLLKHSIRESKANKCPELDLELIQRKVQNVKLQNNLLCNRLKHVK